LQFFQQFKPFGRDFDKHRSAVLFGPNPSNPTVLLKPVEHPGDVRGARNKPV
jgi:hypothetical protein